ncbi:hypothetical protein Bwad004_01300 [Bilophila wadsworthia]
MADGFSPPAEAEDNERHYGTKRCQQAKMPPPSVVRGRSKKDSDRVTYWIHKKITKSSG